MKPARPLILTCTLGLLLTACADPTMTNTLTMLNEEAIQSGNPYRWESAPIDGNASTAHRTLIGTRGKSAADPVLKEDILAAIGLSGQQQSAPAANQLKEVRIVAQTASSSTEVWVFDGQGDPTAYMVTLTASQDGGTDIQVTGPW